MATVRPFRAYRPSPDLTAQVTCPPYDVISTDEAKRLAGDNANSFLHVIRPEIDLPPEVDPYADAVYETAAANLRRLIDEGTLVRDEAPSLYVYRQRLGDHVQVGVVGCVSASEYEDGRIKKHELTRASKEADRTRHVDDCDAHTGPVFLTYRADPLLESLVDALTKLPPAAEVTADIPGSAQRATHSLWPISDERTVAGLVAAFAAVPALYVADGHHRTAAAAAVARRRREANPAHTGQEHYNFFMAVVFPHDQLQILPYHRVVRDLGGLDAESFLAALEADFTIAPTDEPVPPQPRAFGLYLEGGWRRLTLRPGSAPAEGDVIGGLDVSILQSKVLDPILGITDVRRDPRIDFIGGIRGPEALVARVQEGWAAAFAMHATSIDQLLDVADAGEIMPPKSTWFEPKLRSGLLVNRLGDSA